MFRLRFEGLDRAMEALEGMKKRADLAGKAVVIESAAIVERNAKANFIGSHKRGEPHVGGDKPNVVTGNLRRSITHEPVVRLAVGSWGIKVGPTAVYGRRVELGYSGGGTGRGQQETRAFPYFQPAVESTRMQLLAVAVRRYGAAFKL